MITLEEAKALTHGTELHRVSARNRDGTPQRWRVNGKPRVWKTRPNEVQVPIKHGLRDYSYLDETDLMEFCFDPDVIDKADQLIKDADHKVYDFIDEFWTGQQFRNVRHMNEFRRHFVAYLEGKYKHPLLCV